MLLNKRPFTASSPFVHFVLSTPSTPANRLPTVEEGQCGFSVSVGYIFGGTQAVRGDFPFIALLGYRGTNGRRRDYKCGGTLINRRQGQCRERKRAMIVAG